MYSIQVIASVFMKRTIRSRKLTIQYIDIIFKWIHTRRLVICVQNYTTCLRERILTSKMLWHVYVGDHLQSNHSGRQAELPITFGNQVDAWINIYKHTLCTMENTDWNHITSVLHVRKALDYKWTNLDCWCVLLGVFVIYLKIANLYLYLCAWVYCVIISHSMCLLKDFEKEDDEEVYWCLDIHEVLLNR